MQNKFKITSYIILIGAIGYSLFDIWQMINGVTISNVMTDWMAKAPVIIFTFGFILGHWIGSIKYNYNQQ